jgi:hypothetical protein
VATPASKNDLISRLTYEEFQAAVQNNQPGNGAFDSLLDAGIDSGDLPAAQRQIAHSHASLKEALAILPADLNLELHVCYPTRNMEEKLQLGPTQNINFVVDAVLLAVFDHARQLRESKENPLRNFVFSSYNPDVCAALNWKQPNCEHPNRIISTQPVLTIRRPRPALQRTRRRTSYYRKCARPQYDRQLRSHRHVHQGSRPNRTIEQLHGPDLYIEVAGIGPCARRLHQGSWTGSHLRLFLRHEEAEAERVGSCEGR